MEVRKYIPRQDNKFCIERGITKGIITASTSQNYWISTRNIYVKVFSLKPRSILRNIKKAEKMSSNGVGEIVCLEWLGEITLGSDMTKDLLLPCFLFSNFRLYSV